MKQPIYVVRKSAFEPVVATVTMDFRSPIEWGYRTPVQVLDVLRGIDEHKQKPGCVTVADLVRVVTNMETPKASGNANRALMRVLNLLKEKREKV